jgi:hypothetical protein
VPGHISILLFTKIFFRLKEKMTGQKTKKLCPFVLI